MGRSCAASALAPGPPSHRKVPRRRAVNFESFVDNYNADGTTARTSIRYSIGHYSRERASRRLSRGESLWSDDGRRPEYLAKLRAKLRKFRNLRGRVRNRYGAKASAIWKHVQDARPMIYRHLLLEAVTSFGNGEAVPVPEEWRGAIINGCPARC